jgi:hypothetical protein
MFQTKVVEKIKPLILWSLISFENRAIYEIMWKNIVELGRPQMTIWHMHFACWIPEATNTRLDYVILLLFHCCNGCTNAPQYYVKCTLPVLFLCYK